MIITDQCFPCWQHWGRMVFPASLYAANSLCCQQLRIGYDFKELYRRLLQKNLTLPNQVCIWHKTCFEVLQLINTEVKKASLRKCLLHQIKRKLKRDMPMPLVALCYLGDQGEITNPQPCWLPMGTSLSIRSGPCSFFTFLHILTPYICFKSQKPSPARK